MTNFSNASRLIKEFKGDAYLFGLDVLPSCGAFAGGLGNHALLVCDKFPGSEEFIKTIKTAFQKQGIQIMASIQGAAPNAPREDLTRITEEVNAIKPDFLVSFGGGSTIDAVKAAGMLYALGGSIEDYFGTGLVSAKIQDSGRSIIPHLAIQTAASSGAHLTKYSNITDVHSGQKKLVVDDALVPQRAVFDYKVTLNAPVSLTADGALDGISHALEVLYSVVGKPAEEKVLPIALEVIRLVVEYLPIVLRDPSNEDGRMALGLATDLGGYAIMLGGTNGAHLTSFSLVDVLSHGRACGMLNPYYTVFFAPAVEDVLKQVAEIYRQNGYLQENFNNLKGRELGLAVAQAMINFEKAVGFPTTLNEVKGFTNAHIERALVAAKNPQLKMKLENMPVPMTAEMVDEYMASILQAAKTGDLQLVRNVG